MLNISHFVIALDRPQAVTSPVGVLQVGEFLYMGSTLVMAFESFAGDDHEVGLFHRAFFIAFVTNRMVLLTMYCKIMIDIPSTRDQVRIHIAMLVRLVSFSNMRQKRHGSSLSCIVGRFCSRCNCGNRSRQQGRGSFGVNYHFAHRICFVRKPFIEARTFKRLTNLSVRYPLAHVLVHETKQLQTDVHHFNERIELWSILILGESIISLVVFPPEIGQHDNVRLENACAIDRHLTSGLQELYVTELLAFLVVYLLLQIQTLTQPTALEADFDEHALDLSFTNACLYGFLTVPLTYGIFLFGTGLKLMVTYGLGYENAKKWDTQHAWVMTGGLALGLLFTVLVSHCIGRVCVRMLPKPSANLQIPTNDTRMGTQRLQSMVGQATHLHRQDLHLCGSCTLGSSS